MRRIKSHKTKVFERLSKVWGRFNWDSGGRSPRGAVSTLWLGCRISEHRDSLDDDAHCIWLVVGEDPHTVHVKVLRLVPVHTNSTQLPRRAFSFVDERLKELMKYKLSDLVVLMLPLTSKSCIHVCKNIYNICGEDLRIQWHWTLEADVALIFWYVLQTDVLHGCVYFLTIEWNEHHHPSVCSLCASCAESQMAGDHSSTDRLRNRGTPSACQSTTWPTHAHIHNHTPSVNMASTPLKQRAPGVKLDSKPENDVFSKLPLLSEGNDWLHHHKSPHLNCPILHNGHQQWEVTI